MNKHYFIFEMEIGENIRIPKPCPKNLTGPVDPMEYVTKLNQNMEYLLQKQQLIEETHGTKKHIEKKLKCFDIYTPWLS